MRQKSPFNSLLARQQTNEGKEEIERRNSSVPLQSADERVESGCFLHDIHKKKVGRGIIECVGIQGQCFVFVDGKATKENK